MRPKADRHGNLTAEHATVRREALSSFPPFIFEPAEKEKAEKTRFKLSLIFYKCNLSDLFFETFKCSEVGKADLCVVCLAD